jgi:general secretion pathway protein D
MKVRMLLPDLVTEVQEIVMSHREARTMNNVPLSRLRLALRPKNFFTGLRSLLAVLLSLAISIPVYANKAEGLYKQGTKAEQQNKYDEAYDDYAQALALEPKDAKYMAAASRMRFYASVQHTRTGVQYRESGKFQEATAEFTRAIQIDPTNLLAKMEALRTADMVKHQAKAEEVKAPPVLTPLAKAAQAAGGPVDFQPPSNTPMNMRLNSPADQAYKIVGKLAGVNVLFDPDFKPQKVNVELNDVGARSALDMLALQSKTFWTPISNNTIMVAADTAAKRKEFEHQSMKMFFMRNASSTAELQEASKTISALLDLTRVQLIPGQNAMVFRGTPDQLVLAEKLIEDLDKPKPEVMIDIAVLEVSKDKIRTLGTNPPTSISISMNTPTSGSSSSSSSGGSGGSTFTINQFAKLTGNDFYVTIPGASMSFLMSDSDTKVLQNPQIRAMDNEKASIKIGDRIPVATGSFTPGSTGVSALVSTQFQYIDVGVNVDITPHIHSDREVTLKMSLEISSVTGEQNIGGITQPTIGQRRIEQETRLGDGEVNLIGGILQDTETKSLSGYPYLSKIPILKYLFAQEDKQRQQSEVVFAITPHIIRAQEITDQNLRLVDVGTATSTSVRKDARDSNPDSQGKGGTADNPAGAATRKPPVASPVAQATRPSPTPQTTGQAPNSTVPPPH